MREKMLAERETILQKLWSSQNEVQQLQSLNTDIIGEIEQMKSTIAKRSSKKSPVRGRKLKHNQSKSKEKVPNETSN